MTYLCECLGCGCMHYGGGHGQQRGWKEKRCGQVVHGVTIQPALKLLHAPADSRHTHIVDFWQIMMATESQKLQLDLFIYCWSCTFCFQPSPHLSSGGLCGPVALVLWVCVLCPAGLPGPREAPPDCGTISV